MKFQVHAEQPQRQVVTNNFCEWQEIKDPRGGAVAALTGFSFNSLHLDHTSFFRTFDHRLPDNDNVFQNQNLRNVSLKLC